MRIMYVDLKYDYGDPSRGDNFIGQLGFKSSFESLGHEVIPFYYDDYLENLGELQTSVVAKAEQCNPDLIFFCLFRDQFSTETLDQLKHGWTTMNWFGDDVWRFDEFTSKYAPHFSIAVTTDKFAILKYRKLGVEKVILSQWAAVRLPVEDTSEPPAYAYDISFIGGINPVRKWFVRELEKAGFNVECFGHGWPNGIISMQQMMQVFRTSKINLNLSNSRSLDLRFFKSSPLNFIHAWRMQKLSDVIKARNFEIGYYGGFQLAEYSAGIEDYFDIGVDLVCYKDLDEAKFLIDYYLANDEDRERIKKAGVDRSRSSHSYFNRFEHIFEEMKDEASNAGG